MTLYPAEPLIVLTGHRSGSSAMMGLLADAGLYLGDLLPPAPDNPQGFFENRHVVEANRRLLYERDRDWTCPPPYFDHRTTDLKPLERVGDRLRGPDRIWGFKDPRTLFTLPAWAAALGETHLVGVYRNTEDVAQSLTARGNLTLDQARAIALAYSERLAEAHKRLMFPVVSFDSDPGDFLARVGEVANALGLDWDRTRAEERYDAKLVHHRSPEAIDHPADAYLGEAAASDLGTLRPTTASTIVRTWEDLPSELARDLPHHLGPLFELRRREMLDRGTVHLPDVSQIGFVEPTPRSVHIHNSAARSITADQLAETGDPEEETRLVSHLVGPALLDDVAPDSVGALLDRIVPRLEKRAIVALGGWILEGEGLPSAHTVQPADVIAHRSCPPYLHHFEELTAALLPRGLHVAAVEQTPGGRTHLLLTNDGSLKAPDTTPTQLRKRIARLDERTQELQDRLTSTLDEAEELHGEVKRLEVELNETRSSLKAAEKAIKTAEKAVKVAEKAAASAKRSYTRLANRRLVKLALAIARLARPLFRLARSRRNGRETSTHHLKHPPRSREQVVRAIRQRATPHPGNGPMVSIVIPTRNGAHHLARLLPTLDRTSYRSFEVLVVDNGSTDDTAALLGQDWSFSMSVLKNERNESFSVANNLAAEKASGDLLLFLNNDTEPIDGEWLGALVASLADHPERVAAGALLIYPEMDDPALAFTVQHAGIELSLRGGAPRAFNISGGDPLDPDVAATRRVFAATAAALLVRKDAFVQVGGFHTGYVYGAEDVDLCLELGQMGEIIVAGEAALFHYESSTQRAEAVELARINRIGNWRLFAERWGPTVTRTLLKDRLSGDASTRRSPNVAVTLTDNDSTKGWGDFYTAHELGSAFESQGWVVTYAERKGDRWYEIEDIDLVVSLIDSYDVRLAPSGAFTIAWVRNWVDRWIDRPWFDMFDAVVASSHKAAEEIAERTRFNPMVVPLATNPERFAPGPVVPTFESDYVFSGNNWGVGRDLIPMLDVRPGEKFLVFGKGWDTEPRVARYWRGHLGYEFLPDLYRSTKIVLDDTAEPTLPHAFLNARVFDSLAAGALVISNNVDGSREMFDGLLPTYQTRAELRSLLDRYLSDDDLRQRTVAELRKQVLSEHTYVQIPTRLLTVALSEIDRPRIALKIGVPNSGEMEQWGDTHFARSMSTALAGLGYPTEIHILPEWDLPDRQDSDIVIHLRGLTTYTPKPAHLNVMWVISHPDDLSPGECDKYDLVLVASKSYATQIATETSTPVVFLPQATDPRRFHRHEDPTAPTSDLLFVGNSRHQRRHGVDWALESGLPLSIYGRDWNGLVPAGIVRGDHWPNERLSELYASAKLVLNDHWPDMRDQGFISNRIFDVLASGGVVISDPVVGLEDLLGDLVPTYSSAEELQHVAQGLLSDPGRRASLSSKGAELVAAEHTFDARARHLVDLIEPMLKGRPKNLRGEVF